jgi:hypothetical protein
MGKKLVAKPPAASHSLPPQPITDATCARTMGSAPPATGCSVARETTLTPNSTSSGSRMEPWSPGGEWAMAIMAHGRVEPRLC